MSIPKEPRQLMINLMYIVLTAMLALNVSAEILNAFVSMDRSISESNGVMTDSNQQLMAAISEQAEAYAQFKPYQEKGLAVQQIARSFSDYIDGLKKELIETAGGYDEEDQLVGLKNKDVTTRLLVDEGKGAALEAEIKKVRLALLEQIETPETREQLATTIPLDVDSIPTDSDKKDWAQFTFQQMPLAAVLPLLAKLQNDVKVSETSILNHFYKKTGSVPFKPDSFIPVAATNSSYLTVGEQFSADLFLSAYSSTADNIRIEVDGRSVPIRDGKAIFTTTPQQIGEKSHRMIVRFTDPVSGKEERFEKKFSYVVGERSVAVAADKMNVFYVGVDNPISVSAAGVPSHQIRVTATNAKLNKVSNGKYTVKPDKVGESKITVQGGGLEPSVMTYRVKRIPDPQILLGRSKGGGMNAAEFKVHPGIRPHLENFDFDAKCKIQGFELTRKPKNDDVLSEKNDTGAYQGRVKRLVTAAQPGDTYYFDQIKVRCPGDVTGRSMNGMIFKIK